MEKWQFLFVNFAIGGFILQMILIGGVYFISKSLPKEKTDNELLEEMYKKPTLSSYYQRKLNF
tara:strand:+ start:1031 stop:1219 length:189 start_codon:yes stop_codon:yes gene_type:complete